MRWARHVACMGKKRNVYVALVGKTEGRRLLEQIGIGGEENVTTEFKETGWEGLGWTGSWSLVCSAVNFWVLCNSGSFLTISGQRPTTGSATLKIKVKIAANADLVRQTDFNLLKSLLVT
jgi:hypothetical protein